MLIPFVIAVALLTLPSYSQNHWKIFTEADLNTTSILDAIILPDSTVLVSVREVGLKCKILRSRDQAETWQDISLPDNGMSVVYFQFLPKSKLCFGSSSNALIVSTNHGASWDTCNIPKLSGSDIFQMSNIVEMNDSLFIIRWRTTPNSRSKIDVIQSVDKGYTWKIFRDINIAFDKRVNNEIICASSSGNKPICYADVTNLTYFVNRPVLFDFSVMLKDSFLSTYSVSFKDSFIPTALETIDQSQYVTTAQLDTSSRSSCIYFFKNYPDVYEQFRSNNFTRLCASELNIGRPLTNVESIDIGVVGADQFSNTIAFTCEGKNKNNTELNFLWNTLFLSHDGGKTILRKYIPAPNPDIPKIGYYRTLRVTNRNLISAYSGYLVFSFDGGGDAITDVQEEETNNEPFIYPNPTTSALTVTRSGEFSIRDIFGSELLHQTIAEPHTRISLEQLPIGTYTAQVQSGIRSQTMQFVVVR